MADVKVPELAESISQAEVSEWLVKTGDAVEQGQQIAAIETDKIVLEVYASASGTVGELQKKVGDDVASGELLATITEGAVAAAVAASAEPPAASAKDASAGGGGGESVAIKVPELAESISEASLEKWLKQAGDPVATDEVIATIETDKVALEIPSPVTGVLAEQAVAVGDSVVSGQLIAKVAPGSAPAAAAAKQPAVQETAAPASAAAAPASFPAARKMASELGVDLGTIAGSGKGGRATKSDGAAAAAGAVAEPAGSAAGERNERRVKMTKLRMAIANRLLESQRSAAILTTFNEADMSALISMRKRYKEQFQEKHGIKLGIMSFFVKAVCAALREYTIVNAAIDGNDIVYHDYCDVGIAVGSERGLVVPILRNAESMGMAAIEAAIADFGARAQSGKLELEELSGGTFTITNGGVFGSLVSTPIINPPQSAILGVHATKERPVAIDGEVVIRPMNYLALSYDHQIIDGREAVQFLVAVKQGLEDPSRLLLEI